MKTKKLSKLPQGTRLLLAEKDDEHGLCRVPVELVAMDGERARVTSGRVRSEEPDGSITVDPRHLTRDRETEELIAASRAEVAYAREFFREAKERG